jgi:hypothetical protein
MICFNVEPAADPVLGRGIVYRYDEYSFDTLLSEGFTSVLINDLNVEMDASNCVVGVWGLCPHPRWIDRILTPPAAEKASLVVSSDRPFERGVSVRLNQGKNFPVYVDRNVGWVQVKGDLSPSAAVMIFPGLIFELTGDGRFSSLWLKLAP